MFEDFDAPDFETAARTVYARLLRGRMLQPPSEALLGRGAERWDGSKLTPEELEIEQAKEQHHDLIVAELATGRLALLTDDGEDWGGDLYVAGAATDWWAQQRRPPPPATLAYASVVALRIVCAFVWACYRPGDYLVDQNLSTEWSGIHVMAPFRGVTITPAGVERWMRWM